MLRLGAMRSLLVWTIALPQAWCVWNAPCYDPAGVVAPGYYPCDPTAYITNCCPQGWTCFSNALCVVTTETNAFPNLTLGDVVRGMCTNPLWNNDICGDQCLNGDDVDGDLVYCGNHQFCCLADYGAGSCKCDAGGGSFTINDGAAQTIVGVTGTTFSGTPSIATTRVPPSTPTAAGGQAGKPANTTASPTATSPAGGSGTADASGAGGPSTTTKIAVGVAVPVAVLAAAGILLWVFWWRPRRRRSFPVSFNDTPAEFVTQAQQQMATRDNLGYFPPPQLRGAQAERAAPDQDPFAGGQDSS